MSLGKSMRYVDWNILISVSQTVMNFSFLKPEIITVVRLLEIAR